MIIKWTSKTIGEVSVSLDEFEDSISYLKEYRGLILGDIDRLMYAEVLLVLEALHSTLKDTLGPSEGEEIH